jgi:hypothetical protein
MKMCKQAAEVSRENRVDWERVRAIMQRAVRGRCVGWDHYDYLFKARLADKDRYRALRVEVTGRSRLTHSKD